MTTQRELLDCLAEKAPLFWQEPYDNAGLLVGDPAAEVKGVLVALDITEPVVAEAKEQGASLIVSHHPIIFSPLKAITGGDGPSRVVRALIQAEIGALCMHTNLDMAPEGVNDLLAQAAGLVAPAVLHPEGKTETGAVYGIGRVGHLSAPVPLEQYVKQIKTALGAGGLRFCSGGRPAFRVAVGGGSCGSMLSEVIALGCDTFVTGDVKYDVFLEAAAMGINVIDAGHFPTEQLICPQLVSWLQSSFPHVTVRLSACHRDTVQFA